MRHHYLFGIAAASVCALVSLSGCSTYHAVAAYLSSDKGSVCPDVFILANASVLPAFDPAKGADPSSVIYTARMTNVATRCDLDKRRAEADTRVEVTFEVTRPPGGEAGTYRIPYFVAVTNEGTIIDKQIHWVELEFRQGETGTSASDAIDSWVVHFVKPKQSYEYHLVAGFQLTQAQLGYIKKTGLDAP